MNSRNLLASLVAPTAIACLMASVALASVPSVQPSQLSIEEEAPADIAQLERKLAAAEVALGSHHADLIPILIELGLVKGEVLHLERALKITEAKIGPLTAADAELFLMIAYARAFDKSSEQFLLRAVRILESDLPANTRTLGKALALLQGYYMIHKDVDAAKSIGDRIRGLLSE